MIKKITSQILIALTICMYASCTLETSGNGDLDGYWHLVSVDTLATKSTKSTADLRLFWSIQSTLIDMRDADGAYSECIMHFDVSDDSLKIRDEYLFNRIAGDIKIDSIGYLQPYGVNELNERFKIIHLSSDDLKLESSTLKLNFEKM